MFISAVLTWKPRIIMSSWPEILFVPFGTLSVHCLLPLQLLPWIVCVWHKQFEAEHRPLTNAISNVQTRWGVVSQLMTLRTWICSLLRTSFKGLHHTPETKVVDFINSLYVTSWLILIAFSQVSCPTLHFLPLSFSCFLWSRWRVPSVYRQPLCFTHTHSLSSFFVSLQPMCSLFRILICLFG